MGQGVVDTKVALEEAERKLIDWGQRWHSRAIAAYAWDSPSTNPNHNFNSCNNDTGNVQVQVSDVPLGGESSGSTIHTLKYSHSNTSEEHTPIVLIHGYAQSASQFYATAPLLSSSYKGPVYAIDKMGCNLSTRKPWTGGYGDNSDLKTSEAYFVDAIEEWRKEMKLEKLTLVGHSMGGYVSVRYSQKYPERVQALCLLSPVGIPERPVEDPANPRPLPWFFQLGRYLWNKGFSPFLMARTIGRAPSDKYTFGRYPDREWIPKQMLADQLYYNWLHGEISGGGYSHITLLEPGAYARDPLVRSLPGTIRQLGHVSFVYGAVDWMSVEAAEQIRDEMYSIGSSGSSGSSSSNNDNNSSSGSSSSSSSVRCEVYKVHSAGHTLPIDNPLGLAEAILRSLDTSLPPNKSTMLVGGQYMTMQPDPNPSPNPSPIPNPSPSPNAVSSSSKTPTATME